MSQANTKPAPPANAGPNDRGDHRLGKLQHAFQTSSQIDDRVLVPLRMWIFELAGGRHFGQVHAGAEARCRRR